MAQATRTSVMRQQSTRTRLLAATAVGGATLIFAVSMATVFGAISLTAQVGGVTTVTLLGALLLGLGVAVIGFGVGSATGYMDSTPRESSGIIAGIAFSGIWFIVGGLIGSQTLGIGMIGWIFSGLLLGAGAFALTVLPREDIGSTVPAGIFAMFAGLVLLSGVIGPAWVWTPQGLRASFRGELMIPVITLFASLVAGWAAAKAYGGFGARGRHMGAYALIYLNAIAIISVLFVLVGYTFYRGLPRLLEGITVGLGAGPGTTISLFGVSVTLALPVQWPFVMKGVALFNELNGVLPAIVGTFWLVIGAILFAVPLGVGAAIFLSEYAEQGRFTRAVDIATNGLWSTPSIVFGLFGYAFLVPRFGGQKSLISGMLTLGFMLLPLVLITSREAIIAVPREYRDASAALGVSKWETIRSVVIPAALPGVVTGVILGVGRIAGETAPILLTMAGGTFVPGSQTVDVIGGFEFTASPPFVANPELLDATAALPYQLYALITAGVGGGGLIEGTSSFQWATALMLLIVVLSFYAIGIGMRYYFRSKLQS